MSFTTLAWFRRAARVAALLAAIVVVVGAWVRLTNAGLGCPDWPGCYGQLHPAAGRRRASPSANAAFPARPFDYQKALHEMVHRYIATALGLLIIVARGVRRCGTAATRRSRGCCRGSLLGVVCAAGGARRVHGDDAGEAADRDAAPGRRTDDAVAAVVAVARAGAARRQGRRAAGAPARARWRSRCSACSCCSAAGPAATTPAVACPDFPTCQGTLAGRRRTSATPSCCGAGSGVDYEGGVLAARPAPRSTSRTGSARSRPRRLLLVLAVLALAPCAGAERAARPRSRSARALAAAVADRHQPDLAGVSAVARHRAQRRCRAAAAGAAARCCARCGRSGSRSRSSAAGTAARRASTRGVRRRRRGRLPPRPPDR